MHSEKTVSRNYAIDWLRVLAILMIFCFHSLRFFDWEDWHVKNNHTYFGIQVVTAFLGSWGMPLIFVISGASVFYALGKRRPGAFVQERTLRLFVPLVVGIFTHVAWQVYLERLTHGAFHGSFWAFLPHYFDGLYGLGGNFAWMGLHLWYLEMLFVFSLLFLPLLWWLRRGSGAPLLTKLGLFLARPGRIYWLALPLVLVLAVANPNNLFIRRDWGGWSLAAYSCFFLYGFLLVSQDALQQQIQRLRWISLRTSLGLLLIVFAFWSTNGEPTFGTPIYFVFFALLASHAWCWVLTILGFSRQHLNFGTPLLGVVNEAVLPFYIMHQTVLLSVGYFVVQWTIPDLLKWAVISVLSFTVIVVLYVFLVRPNNVLRFLFGMKGLARAPEPVAQPIDVPARDLRLLIGKK